MSKPSNICKGRRLSSNPTTPVWCPALGAVALTLLVACGKPEDILTAARFGDVEQLEACIQSGMDVNHADPAGETALFHAIGAGKSRSFELLMGNGADVKVQDSQGNSPLHKAASFGRAEFVSRLINAGSAINATNKVGTTPLHYAVKSVDPETVKRLMEAGCDAELPDANDETPLTIAKKMADARGQLDSFGRPISVDKVLEIVKILTKEKTQDEN